MVSARIVDPMVGPSFGPRRVLADPGLGALLMNACVANGVMSVFTNAVFGAIAPSGPQAAEPAVQDGYRIAQQNCFRCHNMGREGGHQASRPWLVLSAMASASPDYFAAYVRNPLASISGSMEMLMQSPGGDADSRQLSMKATAIAISPETRMPCAIFWSAISR